MQGLTQQELQDLYGALSPEIRKFLYYYFGSGGMKKE